MTGQYARFLQRNMAIWGSRWGEGAVRGFIAFRIACVAGGGIALFLSLVIIFAFVGQILIVAYSSILAIVVVALPLIAIAAIKLGKACRFIRLKYGIHQKKSAPLPFSTLYNTDEFDRWVIQHRQD